MVFRNLAGNEASPDMGMSRAKAWGISSLPEPVEIIAYAINYTPEPVTLKYCGHGTSLARALSCVPLRAGLGGDGVVTERQLWTSIETARAATVNLLAAEVCNNAVDGDTGVSTPTKNSQESQAGNDSDEEMPQPVLVPLVPWAASEKLQLEMCSMYQVTHVVGWNLGQGELALACLRLKLQFLGFAVNEVALQVAQEHVRSVMLEEHVRNINAGFLFRRELRTQRSVGGDDPQADGKLPKDEVKEQGTEQTKEHGLEKGGAQVPEKGKAAVPVGNQSVRAKSNAPPSSVDVLEASEPEDSGSDSR